MENQFQVTQKTAQRTYTAGIKLTAIICMILFFFPLCTVSCSYDGNTYAEELSGWECATGTEVFDGDGTVEAHPLNFMLLLIPAVLLALAIICSSKIDPIAVTLGIAQIVALLIFRNSVIDYVEAEGGGMVDLSFTAWYTADVISAAAASLLGLLGLSNDLHSRNTWQNKNDSTY